MRAIMLYIRQVFCKHEFIFEQSQMEYESKFRNQVGAVISMTCKKCGYHKSYWKYNPKKN